MRKFLFGRKVFFGNGFFWKTVFFWKTAFFGKRLFLDPKKAVSKKSLFQKKPFPKKYGHPGPISSVSVRLTKRLSFPFSALLNRVQCYLLQNVGMQRVVHVRRKYGERLTSRIPLCWREMKFAHAYSSTAANTYAAFF